MKKSGRSTHAFHGGPLWLFDSLQCWGQCPDSSEPNFSCSHHCMDSPCKDFESIDTAGNQSQSHNLHASCAATASPSGRAIETWPWWWPQCVWCADAWCRAWCVHSWKLCSPITDIHRTSPREL